jgi:methylated-DNA-protein-cysteine methyltransferase-like protein
MTTGGRGSGRSQGPGSPDPASTSFEEAVVAVLRATRPGEVLTYGEVAAEAGRPGAARAVGGILSRSGAGDLPWWRVVTAAGRLVPGHEDEHARRLSAEGVPLSGGRVRPSPRGDTPPPPAEATAGRGGVPGG